MKCPQEVIKLPGGATLEIHGDFKLECIGRGCVDFPCDAYSKHREAACNFEE